MLGLKRVLAPRVRPRARTLTGRASWFSETPLQRFLWRLSVGTAGAMVLYGAFRTWTDYLDPGARSRDEAVVSSIPLYSGNPVVFLDLELDGKPLGRVLLQLRKDVAPRTSENFRRLCTGEPGFGYKGSRVHAVVPGSYLRGGDITHGTGLGGRSADGLPIPDESHKLRHIGPGVLSMVSPGGPGNATSQWHLALSKAPFMDYQNLVFGNVISGMDVLYEAESVFRAGGGNLRVARSGELRVDEDVTASRA